LQSILKVWCCAGCTLCQVRRQQMTLGLDKNQASAMTKFSGPKRDNNQAQQQETEMAPVSTV